MKKRLSVSITTEEDELLRQMAPAANSGHHVGVPSPSMALKQAIALGVLVRPLVPDGETPWPTLTAIVQERLAQRAPRRVRT